MSLIVLIQKLQLNRIPGQINENQSLFARISLFTEWHKLPEDHGKVFEQKYTFGNPGKNPSVEAVMEFTISERSQRNVGVLEALPFLQPGEYEFCLWLREKGEANWPVAPVASWPIEVVHAPTVLVDK